MSEDIPEDIEEELSENLDKAKLKGGARDTLKDELEDDIRKAEREAAGAAAARANRPPAVQAVPQRNAGSPGPMQFVWKGGGGDSRASGSGEHWLASRAKYTWLLLIFAVGIHLVQLSNTVTTFSLANPFFALYVLFAAIAAFWYKGESGFFRLFLMFLLVTLVAFYYPIIIGWAMQNGHIPVQLGRTLILFAPIWVIFIAFNPGESTITRMAGAALLLGWLAYIIVAVILPKAGDAGSGTVVLLPTPAELYDAAVEGFRTGFTFFVEKPKEAIKKSCLKCILDGSIANATQDYYTGTVDQSEGKPIGVYISEARPLFQKFHTDTDDVIVSATMRARTLTEPTIAIQNRCLLEITSGAGKYVENGEMIPDFVTIDYTGAFEDVRDIECTVDKDRVKTLLPQGRTASGTLIFNSSFDFDTWGYVQYGFMDRDLIGSLRRDNVDPALELGVSPRPLAKFTPGPLMIGMFSDSQPFPYTTAEGSKNQLPTFGVTLSSAWAGKGTLDELNAVTFYIPKQFELDTAKCNPAGDEGSVRRGADWLENPAYVTYTVDVTKIRRIGSGADDIYTTIRCPMLATGDNNYPVLGTSGAGIFTFFVHAEYAFSLESRAAVSIVNDADDAGIPEAGDTTTTTSGSTCDSGTVNCYNGACSCYHTENGVRQACSWSIGNQAARTCH